MAMAAAMATALAVVALAIYDSPRGVCAIYEYFRKSNVCPPPALLAPLLLCLLIIIWNSANCGFNIAANRQWELSQLLSLDEVNQAALRLQLSSLVFFI